MKLWPLSCAVSSQAGLQKTLTCPRGAEHFSIAFGKDLPAKVWAMEAPHRGDLTLSVLVPVHLSMQFLFALANQLLAPEYGQGVLVVVSANLNQANPKS